MKKFDHATHDEIVSGQKFDLERTVMMFSIGEYPRLYSKALATAVMSWRALKIKPSTAIIIHLGGYDNDPRELWDIPQAREFIRKFAERTGAHKHPAIDPTSRALLLACGADPELKVKVDMITAEEATERDLEFFKSRLKEVP